MPPPSSSKRIVPASKKAADESRTLERMTKAITESSLYLHFKGSGKKLLLSTGKAAWIAGTSFLVLFVPLFIEIERDAQLAELESHQATLLGAPSQPPSLLR
ncbi:hypothetical protein KP509_32G000700 [Ceratopteris richardii]|uniref:Mitochondrial import receptor subunit TOM22 homolog n=1 Tax=Ceratopteris richardii TaxID=49495 RepID=A0A8T2QQS9_CERRI|nr:hypothetical protein KP509_32G000700 [Ceratopteris richardii]